MRDGEGVRFSQGEHGAAGMGENAVDGAIAGEVVEEGVRACAEHDEAGAAFGSLGENLDEGVSVDHMGFDLDPVSGACLDGEVAEFLEQERVETGGLDAAVWTFNEEIVWRSDVRGREEGERHG